MNAGDGWVATVGAVPQRLRMDDPVEQVRRLVEEVSGSRKVTAQTRLFHDLHLDGDDVFDLLERIEARFGTSFSSLSFKDFFHDEHEALGAHVAASFGFRSSKKMVTVQHLAEVVRLGAWFDPPSV